MDSSENCHEFRFGATITTKVDKRAARRNRLRRRLRECFRHLRYRLQTPEKDLVLIAKTNATELTFEQIHKEFLYLLGRAGLIGRPRNR